MAFFLLLQKDKSFHAIFWILKERIKLAILRNSGGHNRKNMFSRTGSVETEEKGLENITVADVLITKGEENVGSWLWCRVNDNVDDAMKNMAQHNIGSLVVLKPGDQLHIAGIITERDYWTREITKIHKSGGNHDR